MSREVAESHHRFRQRFGTARCARSRRGMCWRARTTWGRVNAAAKRVGSRRVFIAALVWVGVVVPFNHLIPAPPFDLEPATFALIVFALGGIGLSGLFVIPLAIVAAVADYDHRRSGQRREAMYFAVYFFALKLNFGISTVVSGALLQVLGSPLGVQVTGPVGGVAALAGAWLFRRYPEQEVLQAARRETDPPVSQSPPRR